MRRLRGAVLPLVLLALLLIAAAAFAMSFRVTLDVMAARSALASAQAQALAAAGLSLAVAEHRAAVVAGAEPPSGHGPWPHFGVDATVSSNQAGFVTVTPGGGPPEGVSVPAVTLTATATSGSATAHAAVTLYFAPELRVLTRR
ncbi:MAG TPA: hypothetical protein VKZ43_02000 [Trueperaceae bacterium]|nr:hypothetical protein [Trueperaceae bacterium]